MKIVIFEVEPREAPAFDALKGKHDLVVTDQPLQASNAARFADAEAVSTFIYSKLDQDVLGQLPATRLIATRSTGYDHIDMQACARQNIIVCNVPSYGENTVAEHVFALLLAISHRLRDAMARARSGWFSPEGLEGFDLQGKVLGVIGTGNIGRHVIRIARGFLMDVVACDIKPDPELEADLGFRYLGFDDLLSRSDIITLHAPASPETHHLIGASALRRMKRGAIIIKTARGGIIDGSRWCRRSAPARSRPRVEVLPDEPLIREEAELISSAFVGQHDLRNLVAGHVLLQMPNVIVTPHSAFNTHEAVARIIATTISNIEAYASGRPENRVGQMPQGR